MGNIFNRVVVQAGQAASRDSSLGWRNNKNINWKITRWASPKSARVFQLY
jgi:hypothetical protein